MNKSLLKDTIVTTIMRGAARGVGAIIPFFIAAWFGATAETDAFFFVYAIVLFFMGAFSAVLENFIVPFIAELKQGKDKDVGAFVGDVLFWGGLAIVGLSGLALLFFKPVLHYGAHASLKSSDLVFWLFVEVIPLLVISTLTSVLSGVLNSYRLFVVPAVSPGFRAIIALAFIFYFKDLMGVHAIVWGYVLGELVRLAALFYTLYRNRLFKIKFSFSLSSRVVDFFKTVSFRSFGMLAVAFNPIIDRAMASWLGTGAISLVDYADKLYAVPAVFINEGFLVVILSHWADLHCQDEKSGALKKTVWKTCKALFVLSFLVAAILFILKQPVVQLIYGGRKISPEHLIQIANLFGYYLLGFAPLMLIVTLGRAFVVLKKVQFLMIASFINTALKVILNVIFMKWLGIEGIALATTVVQVVMVLIFLEYFRRCR